MAYRYFTDDELACKCGCGDSNMDATFMKDLEDMREYLGFPFIITSAKRCELHNSKSCGYPGARHLAGQAVDIKVHSQFALELLDVLKMFGFNGVGVSQKGDFGDRFIHIDQRENDALWSY